MIVSWPVGITNNILVYNQAARHVFSCTYKHNIYITTLAFTNTTEMYWILKQNQFTSNQIIPIAVKPIIAGRSHPTQHISAKLTVNNRFEININNKVGGFVGKCTHLVFTTSTKNETTKEIKIIKLIPLLWIQ